MMIDAPGYDYDKPGADGKGGGDKDVKMVMTKDNQDEILKHFNSLPR